MRININILKVPRFQGILFALLLSWNLLSGQNNTLHFDGANDYITLNPINGFAPNDDFTVEMWFTVSSPGIACGSNFRRLFAFASTSAPASRFEVGECGGDLRVFWQNTGGNSGGVIPVSVTGVTPTLFGTGWHHIAVVRSGNSLEIFLDCMSIWTNSGNPAIGTPNTSMFVVGHWGGGGTPAQDWEGEVDDIRLWNVVRTATEIAQDCQSCVLTGSEPGLLVYWQLDEGIAGGNNSISGPNPISQVFDASFFGANPGVLSSTSLIPPGFGLTGLTSNFITSTVPLVYPHYNNHYVFLSDPLQTIGLATICSGDPVHFSIENSSSTLPQAGPGVTVSWEYRDMPGDPWTPIPAASPPSPLFNSFSFVSPPAHTATTINCANNTDGYVDREYRAIITVTNSLGTCSYTTQPALLRICCPVTNASVVVNPPGPLCAGDFVLLNVSLSSTDPFVLQNIGSTVHVSWCLDGNPLGSAYDDLTSFIYPLGTQDMCFKAIVTNCVCPQFMTQTCIDIDPKPVCGTITGCPTPATLMSDPDGNPDHYVICPGDDAAIMIATPFLNCIPVWEYMFPSVGGWITLGTSNFKQNTNILPHLKPASSPYLWPSGETCILYRIKCIPLSNPSGCLPCYSNVVRICLKQAPPAPVITAVPNPICKGSSSFLSVQNPDPNCNYEWYCNGLLAGFGDFFNASQQACYWVTCNDGCYTVASNKVCLDVCEAVAIISCPLPVCPCVGDTITLSAGDSYSTCGGALTYTWMWNNGILVSDNGITLDHIPDAGGTTYTLMVTDANGCTHTVQTVIKPCSI